MAAHGHEDGLGILLVGETEKELVRPICGRHLMGHLAHRCQVQLLSQLLPQLLGEVGHVLPVLHPFAVHPVDDLVGAVSFQTATLQVRMQLLVGHGLESQQEFSRE